MTAPEKIDEQIASFPDWRGEKMSQLRKLIHEACPDVIEEWKWSTAVYSQNGMFCAVSGFKDHVKINFFKGAFLKDTHSLFNNGLESKQHRSIDFKKNDDINKSALKSLIHEAVTFNSTNN